MGLGRCPAPVCNPPAGDIAPLHANDAPELAGKLQQQGGGGCDARPQGQRCSCVATRCVSPAAAQLARSCLSWFEVRLFSTHLLICPHRQVKVVGVAAAPPAWKRVGGIGGYTRAPCSVRMHTAPHKPLQRLHRLPGYRQLVTSCCCGSRAKVSVSVSLQVCTAVHAGITHASQSKGIRRYAGAHRT